MANISSSLKGRERREFDAGYDARMREKAGVAKITGDFWPLISAAYQHLFGEKKFLTSIDYWRERQRQAGRYTGPSELAQINGSDHVLSLERVFDSGELAEPINIQLSDNFGIPPEMTIPTGTYRADLNSTVDQQAFIDNGFGGNPYIGVEGTDVDIVAAIANPVPDAELMPY